MDKQLLNTLHMLKEMATLAYWHDYHHCGGTFDADTCQPCPHFLMCRANAQLSLQLANLRIDLLTGTTP